MLAVALLLAQQAVTLDALDRTEVRGRRTLGAPVGFDVVNAPSVRLRQRAARWETALGYTPLLTLRDPQLGALASAEVLHAGSASAAWRARHLRLSLSEAVTFGDQNSTYLLSAPREADGSTQPLQLVGPARTIHFASSTTILATEIRLSRRWSMGTSAGYMLSGGLGEDARSVIPFQRGPRADLSVAYAPAPTDTLVTRLAASRVEFLAGQCLGVARVATNTPAAECAPQIESVQATEVWRHRLSRTSDVSFGAGASFVRMRLHREDRYTPSKYPVVEAVYQRSAGIEGQRTSIRVSTDIAPVVDARLGTADYRGQASVSMTLPASRWTVRPLLAAARSLDAKGLASATFVRGEVDVEYSATRYVSVGAGIRYAWQRQAPMGAFSTAIGLVQVTFRAPTHAF